MKLFKGVVFLDFLVYVFGKRDVLLSFLVLVII